MDGTAYDPPMPGAEVALRLMMDHGYRVVVHSCRDPVQIKGWFETHLPEFRTEIMSPHEKFWNMAHVIGIASHKPGAFVYIDDRAIHFQDWGLALAELDFRKKLLTSS